MSRPRWRVLRDAAVLCLFCGATLALNAGMLPDLGSSIGPTTGDRVFTLYVLKWGSYQVSQGLREFWSPPFFHPTPNVLSFSDHLLGPAVAFFGLRALGANSVAAFNVLVLLTFALGGFTAYWVVRRSGVSFTGSLVAGWAFAFSTFHWRSWGQYQILRMQWIPVVLLSFDRLLERATPGRAAAFLVFYALHVSGGAYLAYLLHIPLAILLVNRWLSSPASLRRPRSWAVWISTGLLALGIAAFFYGGYFAAGSRLIAGQHPSEMRRDAATLLHFLPGPVGELVVGGSRDHRFFPGFVVAGLAAFALYAGWRRFGRAAVGGRRLVAGSAVAWAGAATTVAGLLLADRFTVTGDSLLPSATGRGMTGYLPPLLVTAVGAAVLWAGLRWSRGGSVLRWGEMPVWPRGLMVCGAVMLALCLPAFFWAVSTILPGMQAMRVPYRAFAFVLLPLSYLAGLGWDRVLALGRGPARRLVPAAIAILLVGETWSTTPERRQDPLPDEAGFPRYAHWIARHAEVGAYLELPLAVKPFDEAVPMYFETLHWRPLANGFSSRRPPSFRRIMGLCRPFPDVDGVRQLAHQGITHLVVHWTPSPWQASPRSGRQVAELRPRFELDLRSRHARTVFDDGGTEIFDIRAAATDIPPAAAPLPEPAATLSRSGSRPGFDRAPPVTSATR